MNDAEKQARIKEFTRKIVFAQHLGARALAVGDADQFDEATRLYNAAKEELSSHQISQPEQQAPWREMIEDTKEVFDYSGPETPQTTRDVIEYVKSWLEVYEDKAAHPPAQPEQQAEPHKPDGKLHADGYFTWARRDGYVLDAKLPCDFYLAHPHAQPEQQECPACAGRARIAAEDKQWHEDVRKGREIIRQTAQPEQQSGIEKLRADNANLRSVMIAAAEEIHKHWEAHCDSEGYGPANLMHRLEQGIAAEYAYKAGDFARLKAENDALKAAQPEQAGPAGLTPSRSAFEAAVRKSWSAGYACERFDDGAYKDATLRMAWYLVEETFKAAHPPAQPQVRTLREGEVMGAYMDFDRTADPTWASAEYLTRFGAFISERTVRAHPEQAEPIAHILPTKDAGPTKFFTAPSDPRGFPVYAHPPAQPEQQPVAWRTFDGEGEYDYRTYVDNEGYCEDWNKRNPNHKGWVEPLYL